MILDTSALAAIFFGEPKPISIPVLFTTLNIAGSALRISSNSQLCLKARSAPSAVRQCDVFFRRAVVIEPVTVEQAHSARQAFLDFGKGRHKARLNIGDCFAYALAKATGEPLLFKGDDFSRTDIRAAL
jgi:ribonuclease VapC